MAARSILTTRFSWMTISILLGSLLFAACGNGGSSGGSGAPNYWPTTTWKTSTAEEQGVDSAQLLSALQYADQAQLNLRTLTIIRNGYIVLDANTQPFSSDEAAPVYSVTKSVISLLVGIAVRDGSLKNVDQPVVSFFPDRTFSNPGPDKDAITVKDLLTMQSGLDCADDKLGPTIQDSQDWVQSILDLPMASKPGTTFVYCSRNAHLLSAILTQATGMTTVDYAQTKLFDPLGIKAGSVSWATDPQGIAIGGYGLSMRPHDMAKLGLLLLENGKWNGKQVVPSTWMTDATRAQAQVEPGKDYGYLFWVYPTSFAAEGTGQQRITVVPQQNLIVVMTAAKSDTESATVQSFITDYIVPAVSLDTPIEPNPAAKTMLQAKIDELANPIKPVSLLPVLASTISGKTYRFTENSAGWNDFSVVFTPGEKTALGTIDTASGSEQVPIGLDNVYRVSQDVTGAEIALRGTWTDSQTFVVHELAIGDINEYDIRMEFVGSQANVHIEETVNRQMAVDFSGTAG